MSDVVVFPGSTDHIETEDINRLDGDTAHLRQSLGQWVRLQGQVLCTLTHEADPDGFGGFVGRLSIDSSNAGTYIQILQATGASGDIASGESYVMSLDVRQAAGWSSGGLEIHNTDAGAGGTSIVPSVEGITGEWQTISFYGQSTATHSPVLEVQTGGVGSPGGTAGDVFDFRNVMVREGSDPTFVPSLRIVGTLGETIKPPDMPIVYAADGTPLTVGEGWAGEGVEYTRYDGAVGVGPIVAQFLATDLP